MGKKFEISKAIINGEGISITIEGEYEPNHAHFGGIDLQLKAIKELIISMDFKFAQENDPDANYKIYAEILDTIAESIRYDAGFDIPVSNKELVEQVLERMK